MKTAALFPGQGSQSVGMGEDFFREFRYVREIFDMAEEITRMHLARLCFKGPMEDLTQTVNLQPALTAVNLACLAVFERELGLGGAVYACAGHSLGEYSALSAAGVLGREDSLRLVLRRGELMHREAQKHDGAMQAIVGLNIEQVDELVTACRHTGVVSVANHNTAQQIVITGAPEAVHQAAAMAAAQGAKAVPLKVSGAWHSELIRGAEAPFGEHLSAADFNAPQRKVVFNVTADFCADPPEMRGIMRRQLCSPVRWYDSMVKLRKEGVARFIEIGPGRVLSGLLRKILPPESDIRVLNLGNLKQLEALLKMA